MNEFEKLLLEAMDMLHASVEVRCAVPICHCGRIVEEGEDHRMCYPGME